MALSSFYQKLFGHSQVIRIMQCATYSLLCPVRCRWRNLGEPKFLNRQLTMGTMGLSDQAPTSAPSKKSRSGISWMGWTCPPGVSLFGQKFFFFFLAFFFLSNLFFFLGAHCFSSWAHFGFILFRTTLTTIFFLGELLPTLPTYLPPFLLPAHLPPSFCSPLFCACALLHHQHLKFSGTRV
jgi:hypothetical protein